MKLCFNIIPPGGKLLALLTAMLLLLSYAKSKAATNPGITYQIQTKK